MSDITFRLTITKMMAADDGLVTQVWWRQVGRDKASGRTVEDRGSVFLKPENDGKFIPFDQLTDRTVKRWLRADPRIERSKAAITASLTEPEAPTAQIVAPPWQAPAAN